MVNDLSTLRRRASAEVVARVLAQTATVFLSTGELL